MSRVPTQTSTFGWLGPAPNAPETRSSGIELRQSDNWPIPLVVRREAAPSWRELSGDWFGAGERASLAERAPEREFGEPVQLVSRRRLRLAHALFALLFVGLLALIYWEARVYFGPEGFERAFASLRNWFNGLRL